MDEYNGHQNYYTWVVSLWLNETEASYHTMLAMASQASSRYDLSQMIKAAVSRTNPSDDTAGMWNDITTHVLDQVDWLGIADGYLEEVTE